LILGLGIVGASGWNMATFDLNVSPFEVGWTGILQGLGCGIMWVPLSVVTFASLPVHRLPEASALFHLLRNYGSSIFISLSVMAVVRTGKINYAEIGESLNPFNEAMHFSTVMGLWNAETLPGLAALSAEIARQADMIGYSNAFLMYTLVCIGAAPFLMFVKIKRR
jgi:DHA2 family multidrug resistance protein